MIKLEHTVLASPEQMEFIIEGMRNSTNSWDKSDSHICDGDNCCNCTYRDGTFNCSSKAHNRLESEYILGNNDYDLMQRLSAAGTDYRKFMRMIPVYVRITAPLYWWEEFDTYIRFETVRNSCSTIHKIAEKEFTWDDFSVEHLMNYGMWDMIRDFTDDDASYAHAKVMGLVIASLNGARDRYLDYCSRGSDYADRAKEAWWQIVQLLPSTYNQTANVMLNYEVLANIYESHNNHKLDEWKEFCKWIASLPYSELITCNGYDMRKRKLTHNLT